MNSRSVFSILILTTIFLLLYSLPAAGVEAEIQGISGFKGESIPGDVWSIRLEWNIVPTPPPELKFVLSKIGQEGDTLFVADLGSDRLEFVDKALTGMPSVVYMLEASVFDSVVSSAATTAPIAHVGGYGSVSAHDVPYDGGGAVEVTWQLNAKAKNFKEMIIYQRASGESDWSVAGLVDPEETSFEVMGLEDKTPYDFLVRAYGQDLILESEPVEGITTHAAWFNMRKVNLLVIALIVLFAVSYYVVRAGKGSMYIRKIAGLQAVDEAVGRATEMGRSVLFIPGIQDLDDVQTIAGLNILGSVAKLTAQYETKLDVPVSRSLVMSNGREVVKEAYLSVGRPDFYNDDIVHYVTDEQFGYVAGVDGIMVREEPAACFYLGAFFAESLILAETGNYVGAIQIAGTAMPSQLPFFVAACDYTLIGEELFAASAYLSNDQKAIGSLRGQDVGKLLAMASIFVGSLLVTISTFTNGEGFFGKLSDAFTRLFSMNF